MFKFFDWSKQGAEQLAEFALTELAKGKDVTVMAVLNRRPWHCNLQFSVSNVESKMNLSFGKGRGNCSTIKGWLCEKCSRRFYGLEIRVHKDLLSRGEECSTLSQFFENPSTNGVRTRSVDSKVPER